MTPLVLATTPVPRSLTVLASAAKPSIVTTDGRTAAKICAFVGSPDGLGLSGADGADGNARGPPDVPQRNATNAVRTRATSTTTAPITIARRGFDGMAPR